MSKKISSSTAGRLPSYFRCLRGLIVDGCLRINSVELAKKLGSTPSQVRADLASFGRLGHQGYGYAVKSLYKEISKFLCVGDNISAVILSDRDLGIAMFYPAFEGRGINLKAIFFDDETALGANDDMARGLPLEKDERQPKVYGFDQLGDYLKENPTDIAVIMNSKKNMRETERVLSESNIKGVWNLSSTDIHVDGAVVKNLPLGDILMMLCYDIKNRQDSDSDTDKNR